MKFCPHCGHDISMYVAAEQGRPATKDASPDASPPRSYNQDKVWKELVERAKAAGSMPPTALELVEPAIARLQRQLGPTTVDVSTIVHLVCDKAVVPTGGILLQAMRTGGQSSVSVEQLEAWGYLVIDGKIVEVDDVPVSPAYGALNYWGGDKQFKRWHLAGPITVDPSRNGNPFFMDAEMLAFGATWRDLLKLGEALTNLHRLFAEGVDEKRPIANVLALEIIPR